MHQVYLPKYSPELNIVEEVFRELKMELSNKLFTNLNQLKRINRELLQEGKLQVQRKCEQIPNMKTVVKKLWRITIVSEISISQSSYSNI